jgi:hypothetical protein
MIKNHISCDNVRPLSHPDWWGSAVALRLTSLCWQLQQTEEAFVCRWVIVTVINFIRQIAINRNSRLIRCIFFGQNCPQKSPCFLISCEECYVSTLLNPQYTLLYVLSLVASKGLRNTVCYREAFVLCASQSKPHGACGEQVALWQVSLKVLRVSLANYHSTDIHRSSYDSINVAIYRVARKKDQILYQGSAYAWTQFNTQQKTCCRLLLFLVLLGTIYFINIISHCFCNMHLKSAFRDRSPLCM